VTIVARAATSPELALLRTEGQWGKYRAAILAPTTVYTARVNQTFPTTDKILEITYDTGSGTLADVLADTTMLVGSTAGAHDIGICRVKSIDSTKVYIGETSHINWVNNLYLTILRDWSLWARHVRIVDTTPYMDGTIAYSNQHTNFDPIPIMGCHRVLKLTGASISTQFNWSNSYVPDSTISGYSTSAPSASSSSGMTTSTPTVTFNVIGWHPVYLTVTAANGKTFWGVRWVYVWNEANPPPSVEFPDAPRQEAESGGWQFNLRLVDNVDLATVRERALVIVFAEDYYGTTQQSIGQLAGCENIIVTGWIGEEAINWNPVQGQVSFTAHTAHYWFSKIPSYPDGVKFTTATASSWTQMKNLTVDKGLHHFLHWRTTATRVMDVQFSGDTKYTGNVRSLAQNLWEQLREIAFLQIFARAGVDRFNRLFVQVHPQLVPPVSRTWATVMTITKEDMAESVDLKRVIVPPNAFVDLSGVAVNSSGKGKPYFSLSPGNTYPPYGSPEVVDHLLVEDQAQTNTLAGLYRGWLNNEFPDVPVKLVANNRMIDCFPNQQCDIVIDDSDTPRGIGYSGGLFPKEVSLVPDPETGYLHAEVLFEAETFPDIAVKGNAPGSSEEVIVPPPPLPPLPPIEVIVPGTIEPTSDFGPPKVIMLDQSVGLLYSENFDEESGANIKWETVNSGLTADQYQSINKIVLTPGGGIYVLHRRRSGFGVQVPFIAYAPAIGATFTIVEDGTSIIAKHPTAGTQWGVQALGVNPLTGQVAYTIGVDEERFLYIGSGVTFVEAVELTDVLSIGSVGTLSFGFNEWRLTCSPPTPEGYFIAISEDGSTLLRDNNFSIDGGQQHVPVSTTDQIIGLRSDGLLRITQNGAVPTDFTTLVGSNILSDDHWDNRVACDPTGMHIFLPWDAGQRGRSSDGGATITGIPNLPFGGLYAYDYAGGAGAESRWLAARGIVRCSLDRGDSWLNKEGNLLSGIAPVPSIAIIKTVEY
jgi:hypothetical protein